MNKQENRKKLLEEKRELLRKQTELKMQLKDVREKLPKIYINYLNQNDINFEYEDIQENEQITLKIQETGNHMGIETTNYPENKDNLLYRFMISSYTHSLTTFYIDNGADGFDTTRGVGEIGFTKEQSENLGIQNKEEAREKAGEYLKFYTDLTNGEIIKVSIEENQIIIDEDQFSDIDEATKFILNYVKVEKIQDVATVEVITDDETPYLKEDIVEDIKNELEDLKWIH